MPPADFGPPAQIEKEMTGGGRDRLSGRAGWEAAEEEQGRIQNNIEFIHGFPMLQILPFFTGPAGGPWSGMQQFPDKGPLRGSRMEEERASPEVAFLARLAMADPT